MRQNYATALTMAVDLVREYLGEEVFKDITRVPRLKRVRSMTGLFRLVVGILAEAKPLREIVPELEVLAKPLFGFDPKKVAACGEKTGQLGKRIGRMNPGWSEEGTDAFVLGVVEGARTLLACDTASGFHRFVEEFYKESMIASSLPLVLEKEIPGIGLAGAIRFLNQAGHSVFFLVDAKVRALLFDAGLTESRGMYDTFFAVLEMSDQGSLHPHAVHAVLSALMSHNLQTAFLEKLTAKT